MVRNKNLQSKFNDVIRGKVISPINIAVCSFFYEKSLSDFEIRSSKLFGIIFPSEVSPGKAKIKKSVLGTEMEVIDDDFNVVIEENFLNIYADLESNLASNTAIKGFKIFFKRFACCNK